MFRSPAGRDDTSRGYMKLLFFIRYRFVFVSPAGCEAWAGALKTKRNMKKEEVKTLLKALLEGKQLQVRKTDSEPWLDMSTDITKISINTEENLYRVKPGQKIRPYTDFKEFKEAWARHNKSCIIYSDPEEYGPRLMKVVDVMSYMATLLDDEYGDNRIYVAYADMPGCCRWADDGTVCGIVEQEEED